MAPEVAKSIPYDKSVDVFSFGILLWELCAMEKPFFGFSANKHMQQVVLGGDRPRLDTSHTQWWPVKLHWVLKRCWSEDSSTRPSFTIIKETLEDLLECKKSCPEHPESDSKLSTSHPHAEHGFAHMMKQQRAATTGISPPPEGFAGMTPLAKSERAHTHSGTPTKGRKLSLGMLSMRKSQPPHT
jgi:serine/threonine protein kinase